MLSVFAVVIIKCVYQWNDTPESWSISDLFKAQILTALKALITPERKSSPIHSFPSPSFYPKESKKWEDVPV